MFDDMTAEEAVEAHEAIQVGPGSDWKPDDPNNDLIGFEFEIEGQTWKVTKTPEWSEANYVEIECEDGKKSCRAAGLVRQRMRGI